MRAVGIWEKAGALEFLLLLRSNERANIWSAKQTISYHLCSLTQTRGVRFTNLKHSRAKWKKNSHFLSRCWHSRLQRTTSVTWLWYFWMIVARNYFTRVAQIFGNNFGNFYKCQFKVKNAVTVLGRTFGKKLSHFFIPASVVDVLKLFLVEILE